MWGDTVAYFALRDRVISSEGLYKVGDHQELFAQSLSMVLYRCRRRCEG